MAEKLREEVKHQDGFTKVLADQINKRDEQARAFERNAASDIRHLQVRCTGLEEKYTEVQGELRKIKRDQERMWEEQQRLQEHIDGNLRKVWDGISSCNKKVERGREEFLDSIRELQHQREDLMEDLFGEDKGLNKIKQEYTALTKFVAPVPEMELALQEILDRTVSIERRQAECADYCKSASQAFIDFEKFTENRLAIMKEEIKQEGNRLIGHHASLMKDIRNDYADEVAVFRKLRAEVSDFQINTDGFCREVAKMMEGESRRIDALHRELVADIDEIYKRRKKDRVTTDSEFKDVKKEIQSHQDVSHSISLSVEYLSRILALVLETCRMSNALGVQDFVDRCGEQWLSVTSDLGKGSEPPISPEELLVEQQKHPLRFRDSTWQTSCDLVPIDWRKGLATGEYLPGKVNYCGSLFERRDLLMLHYKMLTKAHAAFQQGPQQRETNSTYGATAPGATSPAEVSISAQPSGNGSASAGRGRSPRRSGKSFGAVDEDSEDPKPSPSKLDRGSHGSGRQRPGSQGQPQAMGSRGTAFGHLGETEPSAGRSSHVAATGRPSPGAPTLRLPSIHGDGPHDLGAGGAHNAEATSRVLNPKALTAR